LSGPWHCGVRPGLLSNRWWAALKSTCEKQPSNNSNPLEKEAKPTTEGDYTLYEQSVIAKNQKKITQCVQILGLGGLGCIWANVGSCGDVLVSGVDGVADGGREECFVIVCGG
jgi:hypothetical protein